MELKYAQIINKIEDCPPIKAAPVSADGHRFVHSSITDQRNFLPAAMLNPRRKFKDSHECCSGMALSMFDTKERAKTRYSVLRRMIRSIHQTIGTHLAKGTLTSEDGIATSPTSGGHFDFHEFDGVDLSTKFQIVEEL